MTVQIKVKFVFDQNWQVRRNQMIIIRIMFGKKRMMLHRSLPNNLLILAPLIHFIFDPLYHFISFVYIPWILARIIMQLLQLFKLRTQKHFLLGDFPFNIRQCFVLSESHITAKKQARVDHQESDFITSLIKLNLTRKIIIGYIPLRIILKYLKPSFLIIVAVMVSSDGCHRQVLHVISLE